MESSDLNTLLAGGGISGAVITLVLILYRILFAKKSACRGEVNGYVIDIHRQDQETAQETFNPLRVKKGPSSSPPPPPLPPSPGV